MFFHPLRNLRGYVRTIGAAPLWLLALTVLAMPSHATEEPKYQVVREFAGVEVRQYAPYTVAEVVVPGPAGAAGSQVRVTVLNATTVRLELDAQGDGVWEAGRNLAWTALE